MKYFGVVGAMMTIAAGCVPAAMAQQQERHWRVQWMLVGGNNWCETTNHYWVREGGGKFRLWGNDNRKELWATNQNADGSVSGAEVRNPFGNENYRLTVPAGDKPREFELLSLRWSCRARMLPAS